jgi:hypothetical protein
VRYRLACLAWLVAWIWPATLAAQASPSSLRVEVISCVLEESAVDVSEMLAIARAELAPRELGAREGDADGAPLLRVDACHDEHLLLRSLKPLGPERRIALHDVPAEQRPRVAALALAELVIVTLAQPAPPPTQAPATAAAPPKPVASRPDRQPLPAWAPVEQTPEARPLTLGLGAEVRLFTDTVDFSYGPRVELSLRHLDLALFGLFARQAADLGEYRTGVVALSPSYALFRSRTRAEFAIALGADIGVSWLEAEPYDPTWGEGKHGARPYAAGFGQLELRGPLSQRTYGRLAVLGGYGYGVDSRQHETDGSSRLEATTRGPFASFVLGLAWAM